MSRSQDPLAELARLIGTSQEADEQEFGHNFPAVAEEMEVSIGFLVAKTYPTKFERTREILLRSHTRRVLDNVLGVPDDVRLLRAMEEQKRS